MVHMLRRFARPDGMRRLGIILLGAVLAAQGVLYAESAAAYTAGQTTSLATWSSPWTVGLLGSKGTSFERCSGALIDPKSVLTAAHCVSSVQSGTVVAGTGAQQQIREIESVLPMPYDPTVGNHSDVAIVMLNTPFTLTKWVQPVPVARTFQRGIEQQIPGAWLEASSYDLDTGLVRTLTRYRDPRCTGDVADSYICAIGHVAQPSDSGGPLVVKSADGPLLTGLTRGADLIEANVDLYTDLTSARIAAFITTNLNRVELYQDRNLSKPVLDASGHPVNLPCNENLAPLSLDLTRQRGMNDVLSSMRIVGDCEVDLWQNADYTGAHSEYRFTDLDPSDEAIGNDRASRLVVRPLTPVEKDGVYLFTNTGYSGNWIKVTGRIENLSTVGMYNNVSSIRIEGPYHVNVYSLKYFAASDGSTEGRTQHFAYNNADLRDPNDYLNGYGGFSWNDTIKSVTAAVAPIGPAPPIVTK